MYHQAHVLPTRDVPSSQSSSSLASSFSSPASTRMPSGSSQSDTSSSNCVPASSHNPTSASRAVPTFSSPLPAPPLHPMGQTQSRGPVPAPPSPTVSGSSVSTKLKRVLGARRKNSEDASSLLAHMQKIANKGKERERTLSIAPAPPLSISPASSSSGGKSMPPFAQRASTAKQLTLQLASTTKHVFGGKKPAAITPSSAALSPPPPPPPKPASLQATKKLLPPPSPERPDNRGSIMPVSPSINPALAYMQRADSMAAEVESEKPREEKDNLKQDWRKSDATMTSYMTIRPGAAAGTRTPRPVSMAESVTSTRTVVPVNRRLSALVTDAEFAMPEEDDVFGGYRNASGTASEVSFARPNRDSPASSVKAKNRRSMSLNLGSVFSNKLKAAASDPPASSHSDSGYGRPGMLQRASTDTVPLSLSVSKDTPTLSKAAAAGIIGHSSNGLSSPTGNIRGRLAAWTAAANASSSGTSSGQTQMPPPTHPGRGQAYGQASPRQPTVSISGGLAPAAGIAMGFGQRVVGKVGRAWGARNGGSTTSSYASSVSSKSSGSPSAYPGGADPLGRAHPNQSGSGSFSNLGKGKARRTPNAPSGAWSVTSSATSSSVSDSDNSMSSAPFLGRRLREPMRVMTGGPFAGGGLVFGRALVDCVRDTRQTVEVGALNSDQRKMPSNLDFEILGPQVLEHRLLPVIVLRSAQHILKWGIQEEGLFRISGRSTHMAKLRMEFDNGADYDLAEANPGDLDPHAVASIFKAYLRELPEPILTQELAPYFEAAMTAESNTRSSLEAQEPKLTRAPGIGLPSGPKSGAPMPLRKPPSLSTLAMPTFAGMRPPSQSFLDALATLIARLPRENRDVLRTVSDLVKETAKRHKITKMPLSNLLLVFCPSMHMSPPLLRVLCEAEGVWDGPSKTSPSRVAPSPIPPSPITPSPVILDLKPDQLSSIIDIGPTSDAAAPTTRREGSIAGSEGGQDEIMTKDSAGEQMSSNDDAVSCITTSDTSAMSPSSSQNTTLENAIPHGALSSAESLGPSTPLEEPPLSRPAVPDKDMFKGLSVSIPPSPAIAATVAAAMSPPPLDTEPEGIRFPGAFTPDTPVSPHRSTPFLSLPSNATNSNNPSPSPSPRALRLKRPSLTLLFSKRSTNSLYSPGPSPSSPWLPTASSGAPSPALSTATAPPVFAPAPKLRTSIDTTPLRLGMGIRNDAAQPPSTDGPSAGPVSALLSAPSVSSRSTSESTSDTDRSYSSALSLPFDAAARREDPQPSTAMKREDSPSSIASSQRSYDGPRVDLRKQSGEDWTRSVLMAADASTDFTSEWSVKDAIKKSKRKGQ